MKKSRFTDSQILSILKQSEAGVPVTELCREHNIGNSTFYKWRAKYGGMDASLMKRMKELNPGDTIFNSNNELNSCPPNFPVLAIFHLSMAITVCWILLLAENELFIEYAR